MISRYVPFKHGKSSNVGQRVPQGAAAERSGSAPSGSSGYPRAFLLVFLGAVLRSFSSPSSSSSVKLFQGERVSLVLFFSHLFSWQWWQWSREIIAQRDSG
ncbi:hypothetical protein TNCV_3303081 [Trichonephila clavipes]|nr:hypothetical protein TNCV_3303081 [Trichonephila clavipes]